MDKKLRKWAVKQQWSETETSPGATADGSKGGQLSGAAGHFVQEDPSHHDGRSAEWTTETHAGSVSTSALSERDADDEPDSDGDVGPQRPGVGHCCEYTYTRQEHGGGDLPVEQTILHQAGPGDARGDVPIVFGAARGIGPSSTTLPSSSISLTAVSASPGYLPGKDARPGVFVTTSLASADILMAEDELLHMLVDWG